jgi:hypothetical protein
LILVAAVTSSASAHGPMAGTEQVEVTLPADGSAVATRAPMPASSTVGTVKVTTKSTDFFGKLTAVLASKPTFGARAVSCVLLYIGLQHSQDANADGTLEDATIQDLFLDVCVKLAIGMSQQAGAASHAPAASSNAKCGLTAAAVHVTITRSGSKYMAVMSGPSYTPKSSPLRISCTHTATGMSITERPRSRRAKLSQVTGPVLGVGLSSLSSSTGSVKVALGVR